MLILCLLACRQQPPADTAATTTPGVLRLGPPAPALGIYGIASDGERIFVSSLHVPFVTIADIQTGAWAGSIDIRTAGAETSFFPELLVHGDALWVTRFKSWEILRFDLDDLSPLETITLPAQPTGIAAGDGEVWVALADGELRRYAADGTTELRTAPLAATSLAITADRIALLDSYSAEVALLDRSGATLWQTALERAPQASDVALLGERVFVAERVSGDVIAIEDGLQVGRQHTGSDTFSLAVDGDMLLVVNRQGAALSEAGAYDGTPGLVTALDAALSTLWSVELDKTIHFLASDGADWWTANEDSLTLSALDPASGQVVLRGPHIGMAIDHITEHEGRFLVGSHLSDEIWSASFAQGEARVTETCGWPFVTVPIDGQLWVPCQESGEVYAHDLADMSVTERIDVATTFHTPCSDGLCTAHGQLVSATSDDGVLAYTDPHTASVRWADGDMLTLRDEVILADFTQHFDIEAFAGGLVVYEPIDGVLYRIEDRAVVASVAVDGVTTALPLVLDEDRLWAGSRAYDAALEVVAEVPAGEVVAAGAGWLLTTTGDTLHSTDRQTLAASSQLSTAALRVPPLPIISGDSGPLRFLISSDGELIVGNTFRGTLERRALPSLEPLGDDSPVPVGTWADQPGLW